MVQKKDRPDFFDRTFFSYTTSEIDDALTYYENLDSSFISLADIIYLLKMTQQFCYFFLPPSKEIFQLRKPLPHEDIKKVLTQTENVFSDLDRRLENYSESEQVILKEAVEYCLLCIRENMLNLSTEVLIPKAWFDSALRKRINQLYSDANLVDKA